MQGGLQGDLSHLRCGPEQRAVCVRKKGWSGALVGAGWFGFTVKEDCDGSSKEKNFEEQDREPQGPEHEETHRACIFLPPMWCPGHAAPRLHQLRVL